MTDVAATLSALKHNLHTATRFEEPWGQFHDEVAMTSIATQLGVPAQNPRLERCIGAVAGRLFKARGEVEDACFLHLPEHRFWHGSCRVAGFVAIGFYFDDAELGLVGFMRSLDASEVHLARLRHVELPPGTGGSFAGSAGRN